MAEVHRKSETFKHFHHGDSMKVIVSAFEFLKYRVFTSDVVDIVIPCTADALKVNLFIYQKGSNGKTMLVTHLCKTGSDIDIYMKYNRMGGTYHGADHYTPLILLPNTITTTLTSNPKITAVVANTVHPPYMKSQEQKEEEKNQEHENIWSIPNSLADAMGATETERTNEQFILTRSDSSTSSINPIRRTLFPPPSENTTSTTSSTPRHSSSHTITSPTNTSSPITNTKRSVQSVLQTNVDSPRSLNQTNSEVGITASQQSAAEAIDQEKIVQDIIGGCVEDENELFFDEFGCQLKNTRAKTAPLETEPKSSTPCSQDIISLEEFIGVSRDTVYIRSEEHSDTEDRIEEEELMPEPITIYDSDNEITEIPREFQIEGRPKKNKYRKNFMRPQSFANVDVEMVDSVPWDVDAVHSYKILCESDEWYNKQKDGRWYKMNSTTRKGFGGIRKIGICQGSRICYNVHCPKLQTEGVCNTSSGGFYFEDGLHCCRSCAYYALRIHCGCKKVTEYNPETKELDIWYEGEHNCVPKPNEKTKKNFFEALPLSRNLRLTPQEIRDDCMRFFLSNGNIEKAREVAMRLNNNEALEKLRYVTPGNSSFKYPEDIAILFSHIDDIKKETDKWDKYLIYKIHCGKTSGGDSYIFKTSKHHLETALKMDSTQRRINGKISMLAYEKAYFDGMHRRVRGFKTLTLWVHHPGMRRMKRLASMEVDKENADNVELFFNIFNEALREYTGDETYKFNPAMFMTDAAGAIHQGLYRVFGESFLDKICTCQWHFKRCSWRQLIHIDEDERASYRRAVFGICKAKTNHEYELYEGLVEEICRRNHIMRWWNWWKVRRYHLVPALRGFGWTGTNWAEPGQAKMKRRRRIILIDAVFEDILSAINEEAEWVAFVENKGKSIGKGPTLLAKRLKERKELREYSNSIIDAFRQQRLEADVLKHSHPDKMFIPSATAKHRVPKSYSKTNPTQESNCSQKGKGRGKNSNRGRGRGRGKKSIWDNMIMSETEDIPANEDLQKNVQRRQHTTSRKHGRGRGRGLKNVQQERQTSSDDSVVDNFSGENISEDEIDLTSEENIQQKRNIFQSGVIVRGGASNSNRGRGRRQHRTPMPAHRHLSRDYRGRNRRYEDAEDYSTDEELRPYDNVTPTAEQMKIKSAQNPPTYCFLNKAKWCQGCRTPFSANMYTPPLNLVIRFQTIVTWYSRGGELQKSRGPQSAYYHAGDLGCLRNCRELELVSVRDLYIDEACYAQLTEDHKKLLRKRRHWIPVRRNRADVIANL